MSELNVTERFRSPADFTASFIDQYFRDASGSDGKIRLSLRTPSDAAGMPGLLNLERDVVVTITRDVVRGASIMRIGWEPQDGGPFPKFAGTLGIRADGIESSVALEGTYVPPGGAVGWLFDEAVGLRIAQATARDLLGRLRDACEADYATRSNDGSRWE